MSDEVSDGMLGTWRPATVKFIPVECAMLSDCRLSRGGASVTLVAEAAKAVVDCIFASVKVLLDGILLLHLFMFELIIFGFCDCASLTTADTLWRHVISKVIHNLASTVKIRSM